MSLSQKGRKKPPLSKEHIEKIRLAKIGKKLSIKTRKRMGEARRGNKSNLWKGGLTSINAIIRSSLEYRLWRESVFKRDNWTCQECGKKFKNKKELCLHHVKNKKDGGPYTYENARLRCHECEKVLHHFFKDGNKQGSATIEVYKKMYQDR